MNVVCCLSHVCAVLVAGRIPVVAFQDKDMLSSWCPVQLHLCPKVVFSKTSYRYPAFHLDACKQLPICGLGSPFSMLIGVVCMLKARSVWSP